MRFDYGKDGLDISIDPSWNATILHPKKQEVLENPIKAIKHAIKNPIGSLSLQRIIEQKKKIDRVCVVVNDTTRPVPSHIILEALIDELNIYGIKDEQIIVLIATGLIILLLLPLRFFQKLLLIKIPF